MHWFRPGWYQGANLIYSYLRAAAQLRKTKRHGTNKMGHEETWNWLSTLVSSVWFTPAPAIYLVKSLRAGPDSWSAEFRFEPMSNGRYHLQGWEACAQNSSSLLLSATSPRNSCHTKSPTCEPLPRAEPLAETHPPSEMPILLCCLCLLATFSFPFSSSLFWSLLLSAFLPQHWRLLLSWACLLATRCSSMDGPACFRLLTEGAESTSGLLMHTPSKF